MRIDVNNRPVEAHAGETILDALHRAGVKVPTLCHMKELLPTGACRMCVVEVEGQRGLIPSCSYPVADGMRVKTHSTRAVRARKTIVELLLANHPDDCLYCVRAEDCELRGLACELGVRERRYGSYTGRHVIDISGPALGRDPSKCILCGKCVRTCEEVQGIGAIDFVGRGCTARVAPAFEEGLNLSSCVLCGQCVIACPTGALFEQSHAKAVMDAVMDPDTTVVVQHAPAVSVTIAEAFGLPAGSDETGRLIGVLRRIGFDRVFDTAFAADVTVMEEASELVQRLTSGGPLPLLTSCSPAWIKLVEQSYPELLPNLSSCKSPQQMLGALLKGHWAAQQGLDPERVFSVAVMPCTAKKFEASRPEMVHGHVADVDAVLTTRELVRLIRVLGLDLASVEPEEADRPFGERSGAGKLFGGSGGVMEAALRTAHFLLTGRELESLELIELRGEAGVRRAQVSIDGRTLGVAVVSGLDNARRLLEEIRAGRSDLHFIEVMSCPGGCIAGGGQVRNANPRAVAARLAALRALDREGAVRQAHRNPAVAELYRDLLGAPLSEKSHHLLHTSYTARPVVG